MIFPVSRDMLLNKDRVKPMCTAIFLSQTRNLMCDSSTISEGRSSSATHLWEVEPFNVCRGMPQHALAMSAENFSWTYVHKGIKIAYERERINLLLAWKPASVSSTFHFFMQTMNFFFLFNYWKSSFILM